MGKIIIHPKTKQRLFSAADVRFAGIEKNITIFAFSYHCMIAECQESRYSFYLLYNARLTGYADIIHFRQLFLKCTHNHQVNFFIRCNCVHYVANINLLSDTHSISISKPYQEMKHFIFHFETSKNNKTEKGSNVR